MSNDYCHYLHIHKTLKCNNNLVINLYNKTFFFFLVEKIYDNKKLETVQ